MSGCDHFPRYEYPLGVSDRTFADVICSDLKELAKNQNLSVRKPVRDTTLCYYSESEKNNIVLGARMSEGQIVIDVQGFNSRKKITSLRKATEEMIRSKYPHVSFNEK